MYVPNGENVINPMMDVQIRVETIGLQQDNENNIRAMDVSFMDESDMTNKQKRENVRRTDSNPRRTKSAGGEEAESLQNSGRSVENPSPPPRDNPSTANNGPESERERAQDSTG